MEDLPTEDIDSDILTKPLPPTLHQIMCTRIGFAYQLRKSVDVWSVSLYEKRGGDMTSTTILKDSKKAQPLIGVNISNGLSSTEGWHPELQINFLKLPSILTNIFMQ